jgi:hypothetical protein
MFFTPSLCVAEFTVVGLYPVPWQVEHDVNEVCFVCLPVDGGIVWQLPHAWVGGVQACDRTGVPAQPDGEDDTTVRVCVPLAEQALHAEYVYVQTGGT